VLTAGAIEQTVTGLNGVVNLVCAGVVVHLPQTEAHEGHLKAAAELNGGGSHCERIGGEYLAEDLVPGAVLIGLVARQRSGEYLREIGGNTIQKRTSGATETYI